MGRKRDTYDSGAPKGRSHKRHVAQRLAHDRRYQTEILPKRRTTEHLINVLRADERRVPILAAVVITGVLGVVALLVLAWATHDVWWGAKPAVSPYSTSHPLNTRGEKRDLYV